MEQSLEKEETTKSKIYAILHPNIKTSTSFVTNLSIIKAYLRISKL